LSAKAELEKLQAMRKELEAESRSLIEKQQNLRKDVLALEEQVVAQELEKEKALVEDLRSRNEVAKSSIAQLEARKKELETKLGGTAETPEPAAKTQEAHKTPTHPEKAEKVPEKTESFPEEGVTITVVESEEIVETQEKQQEEKKFKFF
jgi:hypothetical protein